MFDCEDQLCAHWLQFTGGISSLRFRRIQQVPGISARQSESVEGRRLLDDVKDELVRQGAAAPELLTSVSHSDLHVIVVGFSEGFGKARRLSGVGVDLERASRKVDERVYERVFSRVVSPEEQRLGLKFLQYWVVKEACLKADSRRENQLVWEYVLESAASMDTKSRSVTGNARGPKGGAFSFQLHEVDGWLVGFAKKGYVSADIGGAR